MDVANKERLKAYGFLLAFAAVFLTFGYATSETMSEIMVPLNVPPVPLVVAAVLLSFALLIPLIVTYKPSAAGKVLSTLRQRARGTGKKVTLQSVSRTVSLSVAALANTPILFGVMLQFLVGDFRMLLAMVPASLIIAAIGWVVLGRFFPALDSGFIR
ncbi:MAG: hypothetical protein WD178_01935 [Actinomycetota bacterium]